MSTRTVTRRKSSTRPDVTAEFPFTEKDVEAISERLGESEKLLALRRKAWDFYKGMPMPTLKDEAWRRTDIRSLPSDAINLSGVNGQAVDKNLMQPLAGEKHGALLLLQPGKAPQLDLDADLAKDGVIFVDWGTAVRDHANLLLKHAGKVVPPKDGKFAALATAMAEEGVFVYVPSGVQLEAPLHSVLWAPGEGQIFFSRVLVVVEEGASLTFVHEAASPTSPEGEAIHVSLVELSLADDARLQFVELQNLGEHVWNISHERATVGRDGRLEWVFGAVGSHLTKTFSDIDLRGEGAEGRMSGFYFADGQQHLDHDTQQNHFAANTTSDLLYKGALIEKSRSVWQGMIYVAPGAQKTDGYQANRNLVLSKQARADSIPGLEIMADDVRCTHGATVSQLEEEPIFYLMSRGLPRREAERMVIDGFFGQIMERIPFEGVRERFQGMIDSKLGTEL
jgi:Fe-S cluster assembly protein SufD